MLSRAPALIGLNDENFASEVLSSSLPVLVDFWAPWCGPCRVMIPTIETLAAELAGEVKVAKLNIDQHEQLATQYNIRALPTLLLFRQGQVVDEIVGVMSIAALIDRLNAWIQPQAA
ncbi:thioredoxin [Leptolyngbya sp. 'hensonii']|uniref:thioredoxin n=1 Tax=Leptolyngbya sp. 'hensonii' TaxID=1922337 RepID=UPI00094FA8E5|nr:thioredoxin [Leptolyngbya sp. 'hensonii']OLP15552.1 thioredoxin [Leptolyngbya sp. 'hensonii']